MNSSFNALIFKFIYTQQLLNKALAKREINNRPMSCPQLFFWSVEILLREYITYYQHSYILIHQFNKKQWDYRDSSCSLVMV